MMIFFLIICEKNIYNNKIGILILFYKIKLKINCILIKIRGFFFCEIKDYFRV